MFQIVIVTLVIIVNIVSIYVLINTFLESRRMNKEAEQWLIDFKKRNKTIKEALHSDFKKVEKDFEKVSKDFKK